MQTDEIKKDVREMLDSIKKLRDEIRLEVHLAGMDAKDAWQKLEPKAGDAERLAKEASDISTKALKDIHGRFQEFKAGLKRK